MFLSFLNIQFYSDLINFFNSRSLQSQVDIGNKMNRVFNYMFDNGVHVMKEDVWDCAAYNFSGITKNQRSVASQRNCGLLRIPNNSFLTESAMNRIANTMVDALG